MKVPVYDEWLEQTYVKNKRKEIIKCFELLDKNGTLSLFVDKEEFLDLALRDEYNVEFEEIFT